jgi:hypothetical protein
MKRLFALLMFATLVEPAVAQDFQRGFEAAECSDDGVALRESAFSRTRPRRRQFNLGIFFTDPENLRNFVEAYAWFSLAAEKGMDEGELRRNRLAGKMTLSQTTEAHQLARA